MASETRQERQSTPRSRRHSSRRSPEGRFLSFMHAGRARNWAISEGIGILSLGRKAAIPYNPDLAPIGRYLALSALSKPLLAAPDENIRRSGGTMKERVLSRQELYDLVWSTPIAAVAKDLAISDVGLAKICRRHGIPHPGRGYWAKKAAGKPVRPAKLPPLPTGVSETIRFLISESLPATPAETEMSLEVREWVEREARPENLIRVPAQAQTFHPVLQRTKQALGMAFGDPRGARVSRRDGLDVSVSPQMVRRACLILQTLVKALEDRGFRITTKNEWSSRTTVHLLAEEVSFNLREPYRRQGFVPSSAEAGAAATRSTRDERRQAFKATGILRLTLTCYGVDVLFKDRDQLPLESQLNTVVVAIVRLALEVHRPRRLEQEERERRRLEEEKRQREFDRRRSWFEEAVASWHEHEHRIMFLSTLEARVGSSHEGDDNTREYLAWVHRYIEWADPVPRLLAAVKADEEPHFPKWRPPNSVRPW